MKENGKRTWLIGTGLLLVFALWTVLIQIIDVQPAGPKETCVGFAAFNGWFHQLTGVHMTLYMITDWLGLVPIGVCLGFAVLGLIQLIRRKSLLKVDPDILLLGIFYILVIFGYLFFEMVVINYRPILIDGFLEASYPSSTTLLVLSVMLTLIFQIDRRCKNAIVRNTSVILTILFAVFMVIGRLIAGVHWATDIIGSILLSFGLFKLYQAAVIGTAKRKNHGIQ